MNNDKIPQYIYVLNEDEEELGLVDDVVNLENYDLVQGKRGMIFIEKKIPKTPWKSRQKI